MGGCAAARVAGIYVSALRGEAANLFYVARMRRAMQPIIGGNLARGGRGLCERDRCERQEDGDQIRSSALRASLIAVVTNECGGGPNSQVTRTQNRAR